MEPIAAMLQQTGQHAARQRAVLVGRTRNATRTFATETRGAGNDFINFVRTEAKRWQRYVQKRADQAAAAVGSLAPRALEKQLLRRVDSTLRSLDARVRGRLNALDKSRAPKTARRGKSPRKVARKAARANGVLTLAG